MIPSRPTEPFRFLDLPRELRDEVYGLLLCSFKPRPNVVVPPHGGYIDEYFMNSLAPAEHEVDTSILLASRQIHREAYDCMVKTNRFVRVTSSGGLPMRMLLNHLRVPVVAEGRPTNEFKGYVVSVSLACPSDMFDQTQMGTEDCSLMLLGRDMDVFCDVLFDGDGNVPGFGMNLSLKIAVGPGSILVPSPYKEPMSDFFSKSTQQTLLQPFRDRLRGFKKAKVRGLVDREIAKVAEEDIAQDTATDPDAVVKDFQAQKDEGQAFFRARDFDEACLKWQDATLEIETLRGGSSWPTLIDKGGVPFVARLAEIYFLMKLNIIHVKISGISKHEFYADLLAKDNMEMVLQSLNKDY